MILSTFEIGQVVLSVYIVVIISVFHYLHVGYIYTTDYETWKKITLGEADSIRMMLSGKAKLEGDMAKVMKYTRAAAELTVSAQALDERKNLSII